MYRLFLKIISIILVLGAIYHWCVIAGFFHEKGPLIVRYYFHSLAVVNFFAAYGLWKLKKWGWYSVMSIIFTQLVAHGYIVCKFLSNGTAVELWRYADVIVMIIGAFFLFLRPVRRFFFH